jgi:hypothetical protein
MSGVCVSDEIQHYNPVQVCAPCQNSSTVKTYPQAARWQLSWGELTGGFWINTAKSGRFISNDTYPLILAGWTSIKLAEQFGQFVPAPSNCLLIPLLNLVEIAVQAQYRVTVFKQF